MPGFVLRLLITSLGLWLAARWIDGVHISGVPALLISAFLLGLTNAFVRPVVILLTLPLTVVTLGLFLLVVNAMMLGLVAVLVPGFTIDGLLAGIGAWFIVSVTGWLGASFIGPDGRYEVFVVSRRD